MVAKNKNEKAEKALCWLRGWVEPEIIKAEHLELVRYNEVSGTQNGWVNTTNNRLFSKLAQFKDASVYRPLRLAMIYFIVSDIVSIIPCRPFLSTVMVKVDLLNNQNLLFVRTLQSKQFTI